MERSEGERDRQRERSEEERGNKKAENSGRCGMDHRKTVR